MIDTIQHFWNSLYCVMLVLFCGDIEHKAGSYTHTKVMKVELC